MISKKAKVLGCYSNEEIVTIVYQILKDNKFVEEISIKPNEISYKAFEELNEINGKRS